MRAVRRVTRRRRTSRRRRCRSGPARFRRLRESRFQSRVIAGSSLQALPPRVLRRSVARSLRLHVLHLPPELRHGIDGLALDRRALRSSKLRLAL